MALFAKKVLGMSGIVAFLQFVVSGDGEEEGASYDYVMGLRRAAVCAETGGRDARGGVRCDQRRNP
jgi:hypothetical protein